jgi:PAS domain-containing protein
MTDWTFSIGEVAAMLGISPHTIRAWERRHRMVKPIRTASGQRRYTGDDVELLRQIKHERHVHGLSMRVATMTAQGLIVPDVGEPPATDLIAPDGDPLRMVANLVPEVVIVLDQEGRVTYANTPFVRFCDILPGQLQGMQFADFVDPFDRAKAVQTYQGGPRQRRGWELNLRGARRGALFSFDCWPVQTSQDSRIVLIGRDLSHSSVAVGVTGDDRSVDAPFEGAQGRARQVSSRVPVPLRPLLVGAADPARTIGLFRRWLDGTQVGVALVCADADLTVVSANPAFERWISPEHLPAEGKPWSTMWPGTDLVGLVSAAERAIKAADTRSLTGWAGAAGSSGAAPTVWDVELCPVTDAGGSVTHLLVVVADVTTKVAIPRGLEVLATCASAFREETGPVELLRTATRHAPDLVPNAGSLLALASGRSQDTIRIVAASGVWSEVDQGLGEDLRLALVREVVSAGAALELEWDRTETLRIVPILGSRALPNGGEARGTLAFARMSPTPFPAEDRQLIDEFGSRLGIALERAGLPARLPGELKPRVRPEVVLSRRPA